MPAPKNFIRLLLLIVVSVAYVLSYPFIHASFGPAGVALSMIIAGLGGWFFGLWGGLVVALLTLPLNIWVLEMAGADGWGSMIPNGMPGSVAIIFLGGIVGYTRDLSVKVLAELSERKRLENLYKTLVEASPDTIVMIGLDANIIFASRQQLDLYGYRDPGELLGKNALDFFVPEERERVKANLQKTFQGENLGIIEYRLLKKDGTSFPAELSSSVVRDAQGKPTAMVTFVRNSTERKNAEAKLATYTQELERLNKLMIGRELKMAEMKKELTSLKGSI